MNDMYSMISVKQFYENEGTSSHDETSNTSSSIQEDSPNRKETLINEYGDDDWASPMMEHPRGNLPKLKGNELDLHGCSHEEVMDSLENIMILQHNLGNWPLTVVTGNSQHMKSLVIKHAYRRGFNTRLPVNNNPGSIIVF